MSQARRRAVMRVPRLETLESVTLLSGVAAAAHPSAAAVRALAGISRLVGSSFGYVTIDPRVPDAGTTYTVGTNGNFAGRVGPAVVTGTLRGVGLILLGQATGTLTVYAHRGTLTLNLVGPVQPALSPLPPGMNYQIVGGTGDFFGSSGSGTVGLTIRPARPGPGNPPGTATGRIFLVFR